MNNSGILYDIKVLFERIKSSYRIMFPKSNEENDFLNDYHSITAYGSSKAILIGAIIYLLFGFLDSLAAPISFYKFLIIRIIISLILIISSRILLLKVKPRFKQTLFCLASSLAGLGIVFMIWIAESNELAYSNYFIGLILVIIFSGAWLRFWYAFVSSVIIITGYIAEVLFYQNILASTEGKIIFIINLSFLLGATVITLFTSYYQEALQRKYFLQRRKIEMENLQIEKELHESKIKAVINEAALQLRIEAASQLRIKAELDNELNMVKLRSLRVQMNPHFVFNCMNTIEAYIIENRTDEAIEFLQKFSKLIRDSLENSQLDHIPISQEIESLKLYIHLQEIRHNFRFSHILEIDPVLLSENYMIPPLLIQPYVENAILHGLFHKSNGPGKLKISLNIKENNLSCIIEDDGIGREKATKIKANSLKKSKSLGMNVTSERMAGLSKIYSSTYEVVIIDIHNNDQTGTRVKLTLPLIKEN